MKIETCLFVLSTEVFKDHDEVWNEFNDSDPDCSWGNNRTLVSRDFLRRCSKTSMPKVSMRFVIGWSVCPPKSTSIWRIEDTWIAEGLRQ